MPPFFYSYISLFYRPEKFNGLLQRLWLFEANKLTSSNMKTANQLFERLSANIQRVCHFEYQLNKRQLIGLLIDTEPCKLTSYCNAKSGQSACWVPFDIYMENIMDGKQLLYRSAGAILTGKSSWRGYLEVIFCII